MAVVVIVKACYVCQIVVNMNIKIIAWHLQFSIDIYMHLYSIVGLGFGFGWWCCCCGLRITGLYEVIKKKIHFSEHEITVKLYVCLSPDMVSKLCYVGRFIGKFICSYQANGGSYVEKILSTTLR